jgi:hypothetical protein
VLLGPFVSLALECSVLQFKIPADHKTGSTPGVAQGRDWLKQSSYSIPGWFSELGPTKALKSHLSG